MKREQILETIQNNLKPKYETMSRNHSAYLILKTKEYISLVQEYKTINDELKYYLIQIQITKKKEMHYIKKYLQMNLKMQSINQKLMI